VKIKKKIFKKRNLFGYSILVSGSPAMKKEKKEQPSVPASVCKKK
jgi:hypothetical protein